MATQVEALFSMCLNKIAALAEEEAAMILGVEDELRRLQRTMEWIEGALKEAERRNIQDSTINLWLQQLKDVIDEADNVIYSCRYEGGKLLDERPSSSSSNPPVRCYFPVFSCFGSIQHRHEIAGRIQSLNKRLEEINKNKSNFAIEHVRPDVSTVNIVNSRQASPIPEVDVVGREIKDATKGLAEMILTESGGNLPVLAITGMGGIGKTTLAQNVYNNKRIKDNFQIHVWVCISQEFSKIQLLPEIIRKAGGNHGQAESVGELLSILADTTARKSLFLVLDDAWDANVWTDLLRNPLQSGAANGCILVTTRDQNVAMRMGAKHMHQVEKLPSDSGWELLCKRTYLDSEEDIRSLRDIGVQIVEKCGGLPLAIKMIAGLLTTKEKSRKEWEKVLKSDAWRMSELPEEFRGALYLSYHDLPPHLKQCFLYLSLFPEDSELLRVDLRRLWVAEGFVHPKGGLKLMEELADDYYDDLIRRSILQPNPKYVNQCVCKMHDLVRSLAQHLSQREIFCGDPLPFDARAMRKLRHLSIIEPGETLRVPGPEKEHLRLRTLLVFEAPLIFENKLFVRLSNLRVLYLNGRGIKSIPDCVGNLIHLRMLDLDCASISKLPESIVRLTNLQILNLCDCEFLHTLPKGIARLRNLRRLGLRNTPVTQVPKGIGRLELLNDLEGFVTNISDSCDDIQEGWDVEELESLHQLRWLHISILYRERRGSSAVARDDIADQVPAAVSLRNSASITSEKGNSVSILRNISFLKRLRLFFLREKRPDLFRALKGERDGQQPYTGEDINKGEGIFEKLRPPPSIEELYIADFCVRQFPSWMLSSSMGTYLPYLTYLTIVGCALVSQLPPLGQLPHLRYLKIVNALSIVTIGPEFLGSGVSEGLQAAIAFPKLEWLLLEKMPNWVEWTLTSDERTNGQPSSLLVMPRLKKMQLVDCPKLKAIPKGLHHQLKTIESLYIGGANNLSEIEGVPFLTEDLIIDNSTGMNRISNLPKVKKLQIRNTPSLKRVDNLAALQYLELEDDSMECLPEWLPPLLDQQREHLLDDGLQLTMLCSTALVGRCLKGGPDWPIIQRFSYVSMYNEDKTAYLEYTKENGDYRANLPASSV